MSFPALLSTLSLPIIAAPLFIISTPALVIAQCRAGIVGSLPALNARSSTQLDEWLELIGNSLAEHQKNHPHQRVAPFAVNQIVHSSNVRLESDLAVCARHRVSLIITSLGARPEVNQAVHAWGGQVLHDVIHNAHAHKAVEKGADGLIAVAAGAGGHAGVKSPFALVQEIRQWFEGLLVLGGAIATGSGVLAAQAMGADLAYVGTAFIATHEAQATAAYKKMIIESSSDDIIYSNVFTGVYGNYLRGSIEACGLNSDQLLDQAVTTLDVDQLTSQAKPWRDIWGAGQGVGATHALQSVAQWVQDTQSQYTQARERLLACPAQRVES
jgi:nitronate monooxygenase